MSQNLGREMWCHMHFLFICFMLVDYRNYCANSGFSNHIGIWIGHISTYSFWHDSLIESMLWLYNQWTSVWQHKSIGLFKPYVCEDLFLFIDRPKDSIENNYVWTSHNRWVNSKFNSKQRHCSKYSYLCLDLFKPSY